MREEQWMRLDGSIPHNSTVIRDAEGYELILMVYQKGRWEPVLWHELHIYDSETGQVEEV